MPQHQKAGGIVWFVFDIDRQPGQAGVGVAAQGAFQGQVVGGVVDRALGGAFGGQLGPAGKGVRVLVGGLDL